MASPRGLYWTVTPETGAKYAMVDYGPGGGARMEMPEKDYRDRGYDPPFDKLPPKDQYDAMQDGPNA